MKAQLICTIMVAALTGCSTRKEPVGSSSPSTVIAEAGKPLVIDVRTPAEFNSGHIAGAVNVPLDQLPSRIGGVVQDKSTPVAVHCQGGYRSAKARTVLEQEGYTHVQDLGSLAHARQVIEGKQP
jgi:phage shock protein E